MSKMALRFIAFCLLYTLAQASTGYTDTHPLCKQYKASLWQVKIDKEKEQALVTSTPETTWLKGLLDSKIGYVHVNLNHDQHQDLELLFSSTCTYHSCSAMFLLNCGDQQHYYSVLANGMTTDNILVDKEHTTQINNEKWSDLTTTERRNTDSGDIVIGWRWRFDGIQYQTSFLPNEYRHLIKKAKQGHEFAAEQLLRSAYPQLKRADPDIEALRSDLMELDLLRKIVVNPMATVYRLPDEVLNNKELMLLFLQAPHTKQLFKLPKTILNDPDVRRLALEKGYSPRLLGNEGIVDAIKLELQTDYRLIDEQKLEDQQKTKTTLLQIKSKQALKDWSDAYYRFTIVIKVFSHYQEALDEIVAYKESQKHSGLPGKEKPLYEDFAAGDVYVRISTDVNKFYLERLKPLVKRLKTALHI